MIRNDNCFGNSAFASLLNQHLPKNPDYTTEISANLYSDPSNSEELNTQTHKTIAKALFDFMMGAGKPNEVFTIHFFWKTPEGEAPLNPLSFTRQYLKDLFQMKADVVCIGSDTYHITPVLKGE